MQSDYIMRMIEQFVQALVAIIALRKTGKHDQAVELIQSLSQKYLNNDISFFLQCSPSQLVEFFMGNSCGIDTEKAIICADLIYELSMICDETNKFQEAQHLKNLALSLYLSAIPKDVQFQTNFYKNRVDELIATNGVEGLSNDMLKIYEAFQSWKGRTSVTT